MLKTTICLKDRFKKLRICFWQLSSCFLKTDFESVFKVTCTFQFKIKIKDVMSSHSCGHRNVHEHYLQKDIFKSCIVSPVLPPWNVLVLGKTRMLDSEKMATLPAVEEICHVQYLQNERLIFQCKHQYFSIRWKVLRVWQSSPDMRVKQTPSYLPIDTHTRARTKVSLTYIYKEMNEHIRFRVLIILFDYNLY